MKEISLTDFNTLKRHYEETLKEQSNLERAYFISRVKEVFADDPENRDKLLRESIYHWDEFRGDYWKCWRGKYDPDPGEFENEEDYKSLMDWILSGPEGKWRGIFDEIYDIYEGKKRIVMK